MTSKDALVYLFIGGSLIFMIFRAYKLRNIKCASCNGRMKQYELHNPMNIKLTKNFSLSHYHGPVKYTAKMKCTSCNKTKDVKYWGWQN